MDITLALLCDAANISEEGKLNILGVLNRISTISFPAVLPMMRLVLQLGASLDEVDRERGLTVRVLTEDGVTIGELKANFTIPKPPPGSTAGIHMIFDFPNTTYKQAGQYAFHILIDGKEKGVIPLTVAGPETATRQADES